jgi:hypothetical protein
MGDLINGRKRVKVAVNEDIDANGKNMINQFITHLRDIIAYHVIK